MGIFVDQQTRVLVQGISGKQGSFHTRMMLDYGTNIVAGVAPGKGGSEVETVPVYDTVLEACAASSIDASVLFIPAAYALDAALESLSAGIKLLVCITEHIPLHDELKMMAYARRQGATVIGPNTFGVVTAGRCKIGIPPNQFFIPGPIGIVARSGTLSYEIVANLSQAGLGTTTVVGLGGDRIVGLDFIDVLQRFATDQETQAVVMVGEIGGSAEEAAAAMISAGYPKPVVAYLAGRSAPPGKRMGHAGAIIERGRGSYEGKVTALRSAGVLVAELPFQVPQLLQQVLS